MKSLKHSLPLAALALSAALITAPEPAAARGTTSDPYVGNVLCNVNTTQTLVRIRLYAGFELINTIEIPIIDDGFGVEKPIAMAALQCRRTARQVCYFNIYEPDGIHHPSNVTVSGNLVSPSETYNCPAQP